MSGRYSVLLEVSGPGMEVSIVAQQFERLSPEIRVGLLQLVEDLYGLAFRHAVEPERGE